MKKSISTDLTPSNIAAVLEILSGIPSRLEQLSVTLTPDQLHQPLGDGERSFIENVAHLINCESRSAETIVAALTLTEPLMLSIHPERQYGKLLHLEALPLADLLAYFKFRRVVLLRVLNGLTDAQWKRVVRTEGKERKESVYWQVRGLALHESEHLTDMEAKVNSIFGGG
ncbi:MAG: DinB family protein [Anaerolineae bacterium]|nr:DinB family protein [Anaerolineae bacterium]